MRWANWIVFLQTLLRQTGIRSNVEGTGERILSRTPLSDMENGNDPPTIPFPTQEPGELPPLPPEPNKPPEPSPIPIDDPAEPMPHPPGR